MKIAWTRLAVADLNNAYEYIAAERPSSAIQIIERIEKSIDSIRKHPQLGRPGRVDGTRELIIPGTAFIVPYRIKNNKLEILAVIHGARCWPDSL